GEGENAFMAGADIKEFPERNTENSTPVHPVFNKNENIPKTTIAVLNSFTLGGGLELSLTCDIRIAEDQEKLGLPEVLLGLLPGAGGTQRLPRLVGPAKAKEIMLTGNQLSAEEALDIGLVNSVVKKGEGEQAARKLAEHMASLSLQSMGRIKK